MQTCPCNPKGKFQSVGASARIGTQTQGKNHHKFCPVCALQTKVWGVGGYHPILPQTVNAVHGCSWKEQKSGALKGLWVPLTPAFCFPQNHLSCGELPTPATKPLWVSCCSALLQASWKPCLEVLRSLSPGVVGPQATLVCKWTSVFDLVCGLATNHK